MYIDIILLIIAICYPFIFKYIEQYFHKRGKMLLKKKMFVIFNTNQKKVKISQQKKILRR